MPESPNQPGTEEAHNRVHKPAPESERAAGPDLRAPSPEVGPGSPAQDVPQRSGDEPELDLDSASVEGVDAAASRPRTPSTIDIRRESVRGQLALGLVALVAVQVIGGGIAIATGTDPDVVGTYLEKMLAPTIPLAATAIGFYFGSDRAP
jgi:hypothetical protein